MFPNDTAMTALQGALSGGANNAPSGGNTTQLNDPFGLGLNAPNTRPGPDMPDMTDPRAALGATGLDMAAPQAPQSGGMDMQSMMETWRKRQEDAARRKQQHEAFLQKLLTTDSLQGYLPKPSAHQMLSDALTNFGMARLTNGSFTPIQLKRYEEAFKRHEGDVQNAHLMLQSDHQEELDAANMANFQFQINKLAETQANHQGVLDQRDRAIAQRQAASENLLKARQAAMKLTEAKNNSTSMSDQAKSDYYSALARQLDLGGNNMQSTANSLVDDMAKTGDIEDSPYARLTKTYEVLQHLRDSSKYRPTAGTGLMGGVRVDANNDLIPWVLNKNTGDLKVGGPADAGGASFRAIGAPTEKSLKQLDQVDDLASRAMDVLKRYQKKGGDTLWNAAKSSAQQRVGWALYKNGISAGLNPFTESPNTGDKDLDTIVQLASMLKIVGIQPWATASRNFQYLSQLQQHLPDPENNTPSEMYDKITRLLPIWRDMKKSEQAYALHPVEAMDSSAAAKGSQPSKASPARTPATPSGAKGAVPQKGETFNGRKVVSVEEVKE